MYNDNIFHTFDSPAPYVEVQAAPEPPKMTEEEFEETIKLAIKTYGKEAQIKMLFEEMAELQNAICKLSRGRASEGDVCEEIADVIIMCLQMAQIYGPKAVEQMTEYKIRRLRDRLNKTQK